MTAMLQKLDHVGSFRFVSPSLLTSTFDAQQQCPSLPTEHPSQPYNHFITIPRSAVLLFGFRSMWSTPIASSLDHLWSYMISSVIR